MSKAPETAPEKRPAPVLDAETVDAAGLMRAVVRAKGLGWRLVALTAHEPGPGRAEIIYHFEDKNAQLANYRLPLDQGGTAPSISGTYFAAFLGENEIKDQFGIEFDGLVLDYERSLYLEPERRHSPWLSMAARQVGDAATSGDTMADESAPGNGGDSPDSGGRT